VTNNDVSHIDSLGNNKYRNTEMKIFNKFTVLALTLLTLNANAASISAAFTAGDFKFTGDTYIDTTLPTETRAVGRVSTITQGSNVLWTSGQNGEYLTFESTGIIPVISPTAPLFNFVGTGGVTNFWLNTSDKLDVSLPFNTLASILRSGSLYLSTRMVGDIIGTATGVSYSANGFMDVTGGSDAALYNTNSRPTFVPTTLADMSFGLVGSNNQNAAVNPNYAYITSTDVQGAARPIPEPTPLAILGVGLIAIALTVRNNRFKNI